MEKRKRKFNMFRVFLIAVMVLILSVVVKFWVDGIPPKIESGETLVFYDAYLSSDMNLKVWYPLEKRSETYDLEESLSDICFVAKDTLLAISYQREAVVEYNLTNHSLTEICSLNAIADSFSQVSEMDAGPSNFALPEYVGEKYLVLKFQTDPDGFDYFEMTFLYDLQNGTVSLMEEPKFTLVQDQADKTTLSYVDAITHEVVEIDATNPSRKITDRISPVVSHDGTMQISDNDELLSADTGEVIASLKKMSLDGVTDFTFSADDQYIAFYYFIDELFYTRQTGYACVYDLKRNRFYTFCTKEFMTSNTRIDWLPA